MFHIGQQVQIIDPYESPNEWATFTISDKQETSSGYCYRLSPSYDHFWAQERDLVLVAT